MWNPLQSLQVRIRIVSKTRGFLIIVTTLRLPWEDNGDL